MEETNSLIEQRKAKLAALRAKGIDPFKNKFLPKQKCAESREKYSRGEYIEGQEVELAGRITAHREMGKSTFIDIKDQSGRIQVYAQKNALGEDQWQVFTHLDLADFIGVKGTMFTTKTGEISVKLVSFVILGKALRPPPEKWHGLADTEIRYRQRYLDLIANDDVKKVFLQRSAVIREIRGFFHGRGYVEVETPMMQPIPGGAAAQPFKTFHNALGCEFFLRIAIELYHKRLLVGGIDKIFEIGKNFRNEGLSRKHNPEFTMLEAYDAFGDYDTMMETVESLICGIAEKVLGGLQIRHDKNADLQMQLSLAASAVCHAISKLEVASLVNVRERWEGWLKTTAIELDACLSKVGKEPSHSLAARAKSSLEEGKQKLSDDFKAQGDAFIKENGGYIISLVLSELIRSIEKLEPLTKEKLIDLSRPWKRAKYKDLVREKAGADWFEISFEQRRERATSLGAEIGKEYEDFEITGAVFEKLIEPTLINPVFVTHLPKELVPLAKLSPEDPSTVEVFECCINGAEIAPGYTEQNDPIEQRERLQHQAGGEQQKLDEDFLVALEHGMPPAGGIGIGIDRLCMMLLGQESIRDVILFPQMKPKG
ncbi:MAG: lysyl-tRNA synthetase [Verrucomicrobiales bacterium]|nr:lysyl-tRNA synthetase [Verrucomicrobiales bacterium]